MTSDSMIPQNGEPDEGKASVLVTISTPGEGTPICRLGNSEEFIGSLTVGELIRRVVSPNSLFSVGVPMSQLEAENPTALAIGELVNADSCEVCVSEEGGNMRPVPLGEEAKSVARVQTGAQGNRFMNLRLEVRSASDAAPPAAEERRHTQSPSAAEVPEKPMAEVPSEAAGGQAGEPTALEAGLAGLSAAATAPSPPPVEEQPEAASEPAAEVQAVGGPVEEAEEGAEAVGETRAAAGSGGARGIMAIVAEESAEPVEEQPSERKEYVRKTDWLRAQFLPEVDALDFSGLFVGNLGLGIREEQTRRNVVMSDPSRTTEVLLRANGYRRSGDHAKALICYQELVDMDPANADFRFLLGKTLTALGEEEQASEAFTRAKELGHEGAEEELDELNRSTSRSKGPLGFLRFWKQ